MLCTERRNKDIRDGQLLSAKKRHILVGFRIETQYDYFVDESFNNGV